MQNFDDDVPYPSSGSLPEALLRLAGEGAPADPNCRHCDGSGWFYGDQDLGACPCIGDRPMYGYWLHPESNSGGVYRTLLEKAETLNGGEAEEVSFEEYRKARDAGWDVEWTENEEL